MAVTGQVSDVNSEALDRRTVALRFASFVGERDETCHSGRHALGAPQ